MALKGKGRLELNFRYGRYNHNRYINRLVV